MSGLCVKLTCVCLVSASLSIKIKWEAYVTSCFVCVVFTCVSLSRRVDSVQLSSQAYLFCSDFLLCIYCVPPLFFFHVLPRCVLYYLFCHNKHNKHNKLCDFETSLSTPASGSTPCVSVGTCNCGLRCREIKRLDLELNPSVESYICVHALFSTHPVPC